ncbi:DNA cytosine methyltransferase [Rhodosalinus sp. 5P4]|uniref:DNA cytosine methyltransferase n=1 Tax=Rhodosalinus sp. 5P4 TaxID=3239196 RepID=UPI00352614F4
MRKGAKGKEQKRGFGICGVDLFCGAGGLTRGLEKAGLEVRLGVDLDAECKFPYEENNSARFLEKSVSDVNAAELNKAFEGAEYKLLAGCAPCQPFSTYQQGKIGPSDERWNLLMEFGRLVREVNPDLVTMENVPRLAEQEVFSEFVCLLEDSGFHVSHAVVNCADYGVPQQRNRLVLLASKLGELRLCPPTTPEGKRKTVRDAIGKLPPIEAGQRHDKDPLHHSSRLSELNLLRIRASKPGGSWRDWDEDLVAACHRKDTGKTYASVYGRMVWDAPAPTMTTQYFGFGNGRFGHPEQDRAISLREGAVLQSFPKGYKFVPKGAPIHTKHIGRLIGNAVPVNLGRAIGKSIIQHVEAIKAGEAEAA